MIDALRCRRRNCGEKMTDTTDAIGRVKYHCPKCAARAAAVAPALVARVRELETQLAKAQASPASEVPLQPRTKYHTCGKCPTIVAKRMKYCAACKPTPTAWKGSPRICASCDVEFQPKWDRQRRCSACSQRGVGRAKGHPCRGCGATLRVRGWHCPSCKQRAKAAAPVRAPRGAVRPLVLDALQAGVADSKDIRRFVHERGVPATTTQISQALWYLRQTGAVRRTARGAGWTSSTFALVGAPTP